MASRVAARIAAARTTLNPKRGARKAAQNNAIGYCVTSGSLGEAKYYEL